MTIFNHIRKEAIKGMIKQRNSRVLWVLILTLIPLWSMGQTDSLNTTKRILKFDLKAEIDPRTNRLVRLALDEAEDIDADLVIIEMDTPGGAVSDALDIVNYLLDFDKPVYVYINKNAASAGALISIACDSIYMATGARMGAATVVVGDGSAAPDKYQSYMRATMRSTAEAKGRNPDVAEAMVDENIALDSIAPEGSLLTFSTSEAIQYDFCEGELNSLEDILSQSNITDYEVVEYKLGASEQIISFFLNPLISGILILVIIGGIYFELQTPGVGFPIAAAVVALILYFIPYYLNGLAENWEIIMFVIGVVLLAVEIFVIPGFGVAGISGVVLMVGSLVLAMLNNDAFDFSFVATGDIFVALFTAVGGIVGGIIFMFIAGVKFTDSKFFKRIALENVQLKSEGYTTRGTKASMVGKQGTAYTVLRPSGKVMIDGDLYDAFTRGNFINKE